MIDFATSNDYSKKRPKQMVLPKRPTANEIQNFLGGRHNGSRRRRMLLRRLILVVPLMIFGWIGLSFILLLKREQTKEIPIPSPPNRRFPEYGTGQFFELCPWILSSDENNGENDDELVRRFSFFSSPSKTRRGVAPRCITRVHPKPDEYEGLAEWLTKVVSGFIDSKLRNCLLVLDYGDSIRLKDVIRPITFDWSTKDYSNVPCRMDREGVMIAAGDNPWSEPSNIRCDSFAKKTLHNILSPRQRELGVSLQPSGIHIPNYRHIFKNMTTLYNLHEDQFEDLKIVLPGFQLQTGFACAMASTWALANPQASQFQSNLFSELLPQLRDPYSVVITLYVRSGETDAAAKAAKEGLDGLAWHQGNDAVSTSFEHIPEVQNTLKCAHDLEMWALEQRGRILSNHTGTRGQDSPSLPSFPPPLSTPSRIIWLLVTDSVPLKTWVQSKYDQKPVSSFQQTDDISATDTNRIVLTTTAKGTHTRASRNPQNADFGEAFIDWWLMGEADVLVTSSPFYSFGTSAALRTSIPLYDGSDCKLLPVVQEGASPSRQQP